MPLGCCCILSNRISISQCGVCGNRSTATALTGWNGVPFTRLDGALQRSTKLPMAALGLQETYRSRLMFSAFRMARITLECRPARGGSRTATSCWEDSLLTKPGTRSSALPQWNSTLLSSRDHHSHQWATGLPSTLNKTFSPAS